MKLVEEINDLIKVRSFMLETINNGYASKNDVRYAQKTLPKIESKIFSLLSDDSFKKYINLEE